MTAIDTNVLIYCCDQSNAPKQQRALEVLASADDVVLLWQVAAEFVAASRKLTGQGFTPAHAWARLNEFMAVLPLVLPSPKLFEYARPLHRDQRVSFWDAMIIAACIDCGAQVLYSEDLPGGDIAPNVHIVNPF